MLVVLDGDPLKKVVKKFGGYHYFHHSAAVQSDASAKTKGASGNQRRSNDENPEPTFPVHVNIGKK